jgi:hypothetical protein
LYERMIRQRLADIPDSIVGFDDERTLILEMLLVEGILIEPVCGLLPHLEVAALTFQWGPKSVIRLFAG